MSIMSIPDKATGKASYFEYSGFKIPITRVNVRATRNLADMTDSDDFDGTTGLIGRRQLPTSAVCEGTIEGCYRRSTTPGVLIRQFFSGETAVRCVFGLDSQTVVGSGDFDLTDYTQDIPVEDVVRFSCTVRSNGSFRPNG